MFAKLQATFQLMYIMMIPQRKKSDPKLALSDQDKKNVQGKTIVFTGGTNGMGLEAVKMLYKMGANIILLGRNEARGQAIITELSNSSVSGKITLELCDLSSMDSVKNTANRILEKYSQIDILINCAGMNTATRTLTKDGIESIWATNYFAPYLFTSLLADRIKQSKNARIVNLTTDTNIIDTIPLGNINTPADFLTENAYFESKLALNMFSVDLADELKQFGVNVNYLAPGFIKTNLLSNFNGMTRSVLQFLMNAVASPTEVGADRIVRLATSSIYSDKTGVFTYEDTIKPPHRAFKNIQKRKELSALTKKFLKQWLPN